MAIPYRTRRALRRLGIAAVVLLLAAVVAWMCWVIWLERYIVYSSDGAKLDFSLSHDFVGGQVAVEPEKETVFIYYNEGNNVVQLSTELEQLSGYYADTAALTAGIDQVRAQIQTLDGETPIMLDVKHEKGYFYYSTSVGSSTYDSKLDIAAMDQLIADLAKSEHYLIARIPALREYDFIFLDANSKYNGLDSTRGEGYLWMDSGAYWLDPTTSGTLTYLIQIVTELRELGFDEVVLDEFRFPETDQVLFTADKSKSLTDAAATLVSACSTDNFCVSFVQANTAFTLPEGRTRVYLKDVAATDAASKAESFGLEDPEIRVVFISESNDTRYDDYGILRPLDTAH